MKIVAVIPARYQSTRFEGKPLADIHGKPMIYYVYKRVEESEMVDELLVATDDRRIYETVQKFGGQAVMTSPEHPTGTDRVAEVAAKLNSDIVVNVQGDEPLVRPEMIDLVVAPLLEDESLKVVNLITRITEPSDYVDTTVVKAAKDKYDNLIYLTRAPIPYPKTKQRFVIYKQIGLYAFRREFLRTFVQLEQTDLELMEGIEFLRLIENGVRVYFNIGNPNFADYKDVKLKLFWGAKWNSASNTSYDNWRQSLVGAEYSFPGPLPKGKWTSLKIDLAFASGQQLDYIECEMEVLTVELSEK